MAFTEAQLQAEIDAETGGPGAGFKITQFQKGDTVTDVFVQNYNATSRKAGWTQILNTRTAAQAHTDIETSLKM